MEILHLNSNFVFTKIYQNQLNNMSQSFTHKIFNPVKPGAEFKVDIHSELYAPSMLSKYDSLLSLHRRNKSMKYLEKHLDIQSINLTHAHTLTNDGLLSYALFKKYDIPYILTIRNTDINFSLKYKVHLRRLFKQAIQHASVVIFPNHVYKQKLLSYFKNDKEFEQKIENAPIIPNGIDNYWHEHRNVSLKSLSGKQIINLLFVGRIYDNKNLHRVLKAMNKINQQHHPYTLQFNVVGNAIDQDYFNQLKKDYQFNYYGQKNKEEISMIMEEMDIFTMPSQNETFGLVFIEAMSQNLPIVYTKNEGIDGYFPDKVYGTAVDAMSEEEIEKGILYVLEHYDTLQNNLAENDFLKDFKWSEIGKEYDKLYRDNAL